MLSLAVSLKMYGRELTDPMRDVYWRALATLTDDDFERAAEIILRSDTDFPPPARFLDVLRPDAEAEAGRALARAWMLGKEVLPGEGCWWSAEKIRAEVGPAAAEAFHACGGSSAFKDVDSEYHGAGIRKAFIAAYRREVQLDVARALPAGPNTPALTTGQLLALASGMVKPETLDAVRAEVTAQPAAARAAVIATLTKPEPTPTNDEEQAALDRLGEKIEAKRRELAALTPTGDVR